MTDCIYPELILLLFSFTAKRNKNRTKQYRHQIKYQPLLMTSGHKKHVKTSTSRRFHNIHNTNTSNEKEHHQSERCERTMGFVNMRVRTVPVFLLLDALLIRVKSSIIKVLFKKNIPSESCNNVGKSNNENFYSSKTILTLTIF